MIRSALVLLLLVPHFHHRDGPLPFQDARPIFQDVKVVSYSTGKINAASYENYSFWIKDGKRAYIQYTYGKDSKDVLARYLGADSLSGEHGFKIQIPGKPVYYILPEGYKLKVTDRPGRYLRHLTWEREEPGGSTEPADTPATVCEICAGNEKEAMQIIQRNFLR